jgi:hypothetical protein
VKKKPRVSRPLVNTVQLAIERARVPTEKQRADLLVPANEALLELTEGRGDVPTWQQMADALNLSEALCEFGIVNDRAAMGDRAREALGALMTRVRVGNGWTLYAQEVRALQGGMWLYRVQLEHCSHGELLKAFTTVRNRISAVLAGNASRRATVHDTNGVGK